MQEKINKKITFTFYWSTYQKLHFLTFAFTESEFFYHLHGSLVVLSCWLVWHNFLCQGLGLTWTKGALNKKYAVEVFERVHPFQKNHIWNFFRPAAELGNQSASFQSGQRWQRWLSYESKKSHLNTNKGKETKNVFNFFLLTGSWGILRWVMEEASAVKPEASAVFLNDICELNGFLHALNS